MNTVPYKGENWPVSPAWAEKHLAGDFAELVTWPTGSQHDSASPDGLWGRLWAILRKSDATLAERTAGMTHKQVGELKLQAVGLNDQLKAMLMAKPEDWLVKELGMTYADVEAMAPDPELAAKARVILATLTPEETRELRAVEAHINVRRLVDHLLGRDLAEFDIQFVDHAHGQGVVPLCGCDLLTVVDDDKLARTHAGEEGLKFMHAHFPRKLCNRHAHLHAVAAGSGRWHNQTLADRLGYVFESVLADREAQPEAAVA